VPQSQALIRFKDYTDEDAQKAKVVLQNIISRIKLYELARNREIYSSDENQNLIPVRYDIRHDK
jgi:hypothetical protein